MLCTFRLPGRTFFLLQLMSSAEPESTVEPQSVAATNSDESAEQKVDAVVNAKDGERAKQMKESGNQKFGEGEWTQALECYQSGVEFCPEIDTELLAVLHNNSGACHIMLQQWNQAVASCSDALKSKPEWTKALVRRAKAWEESDRQFEALEDWKAVLKNEAGNADARKNVARLEPIVAAKTEKQKEEVLGKLKDLGNSLLGKFGMSLDNFKAVKDPNTGSYSISYGK